jgi:hypothetical protein
MMSKRERVAFSDEKGPNQGRKRREIAKLQGEKKAPSSFFTLATSARPEENVSSSSSCPSDRHDFVLILLNYYLLALI